MRGPLRKSRRVMRRPKLARPFTAAMVAIILFLVAFIAPGPYLLGPPVLGAVVVGCIGYLYPGRRMIHLSGGILPPVLALGVFALMAPRTSDLNGALHGPSRASRAAAVVLVYGVPAVIGLLVGYRVG